MQLYRKQSYCFQKTEYFFLIMRLNENKIRTYLTPGDQMMQARTYFKFTLKIKVTTADDIVNMTSWNKFWFCNFISLIK